MPTILTVGPYRFFFYAGDRNEPPHTHIQRERLIAKFWLQPVRLASSGHFNRIELIRIHAITQENQNQLLEAWHDYFGNPE